MKTYQEFVAGNIAGQTATQIISQLDPQMKAQWDKLVADFPKLFDFLNNLRTVTRNTWKVTPAQFTMLLNKSILGVAGAKNIGSTAPLAPK